jgi:hypothetical protein
VVDPDDEGNAALEHKHANHITRVSLRLMMPSYKAVFKKLFQSLEVVEPTYKDIILLYRCACLLRAFASCGCNVLALGRVKCSTSNVLPIKH